jgi:predicted metalloprotease with PDZ domain
MKYNLLLACASLILISCGTSKPKVDDTAVNNPIITAIDLTKVADDKVPVTINPGRFTKDTVTYRLPRVIQGTYSVSDFGTYIENLKALNYNGEALPVVKADENTWTITNAKQLDKIQYLVNDTFDTESIGGFGQEEPFSPAGTNIEPNNYVLNLHGFIGYFDSLKNNQYQLSVTAPADFKRTSALEDRGIITSEDGKTATSTYFAQRYFDITDNPMMYGQLDVEEFMVGDIKIVLSVYSPNKKHTAAELKETVFKMMKAQKAYLGDINSTPRYDIYLYLSDGSATAPKGFGALEHHTSTVVVLPENSSPEMLAKSITDVVSHEFFHIVTPLTVHSEDVHYFDYNQPTFSKHLWMYEGVTEYFATHFQVKEGLVDANEFYNELKSKITFAKNFNDSMSFTKMSENILEQPYARNYANVYQKGALIGMCLDILMRKESNGTRSLLSLMKELSNKYGKNKPFTDDELFDEITKLTYPAIGEFLATYVSGETPINYDDFFKMVGLKNDMAKIETTLVQAGSEFIFGVDRVNQEVLFSEKALENSFWAAQGIQANDVIKSVNGEDVTFMNAQQVLGGMMSWSEGQEIELELKRNGVIVPVKAKVEKAYSLSDVIREDPNATEAQITLRNAWLKG